MKSILLLIFILIINSSFSQDYLLENEKVIYSFNTQKGKRLVIANDTIENYLVYRFGTIDKIEFEFPEDLEQSWTKFKFSSYMRGGGVQNEGIDLNYLYFMNGNYRYVIFSEYYSVDNIYECGIKVTNLTNNKTSIIQGDINSATGTLVDLRFNDKIEKTEELFE